MSNIFLCSDHHFHHKNILTFKRNDGSPLRVFDNITHMNEYIVYKHNLAVGPKDKCYFLGDVTMARNEAGLEILGRMNGEKVLIKGNHDLASANQYLKYFKDIRSSHQLEGMLLTHIPIHPESLSRWSYCVHGHLHSNRVMVRGFNDKPVEIDHRYYSVCMEQLDDYTPVSIEQVKKNVLEAAS